MSGRPMIGTCPGDFRSNFGGEERQRVPRQQVTAETEAQHQK